MNLRRLFSKSSKKHITTDPLWHAVNALIRARNYSELWPILEKHPKLLKPRADKILKQRIADAHRKGDNNLEQFLIKRRNLLQRSRKIGFKAAFVEMEGMQHGLPPLWRAIGGFLRIQNNSELWAFVEKNPELLSDETDKLMMERIMIAQQQGDSNLKRLLESRYNLLRLMRRFNVSTIEFNTGVGVTLKASSGSYPEELLLKFIQAQKLTVQYGTAGDGKVFDEAKLAWQSILSHPSYSLVSSDFRIDTLLNLAHLLMYGYQVQNTQADLDHALINWQKAVDLMLPDYFELPSHLKDLADGYKIRYDLTNKLDDLEQAIKIYRKVVEITPPNDSSWTLLLDTLGSDLRILYKRSKNLFDLEGAIHFCRQAVDTTPEDSPNRLMYLNNLGNALMIRYENLNKFEDLDEAIRFYEEAVERSPSYSPGYPLSLNNLHTSLTARFKSARHHEDSKAIEQIEQKIKAIQFESDGPSHQKDNKLVERKEMKDKAPHEKKTIGLFAASLRIFGHPRKTINKLFTSLNTTSSVVVYFLGVTTGILLLSWSYPEITPFHFRNFWNDFRFPSLGTTFIVFYTIASACYLSFITLRIVDSKSTQNNLFATSIILSFISLGFLSPEKSFSFEAELISPTNPALQLGIALFLTAWIVPLAFSTSLYITAVNQKSSKVTRQDIVGLTNRLLFIFGFLFFIHKLLLAIAAYIFDSEKVIVIQVGIAALVLMMFLYLINILLEGDSTEGPHRFGIITALGFNFLNIFPHLLTAYLVSILTSTVYKSISASGTFGSKFFGVLLASLVFIVMGGVLYTLTISLLYFKGGMELIYKFFWQVRVDVLLSSHQARKLEDDWQIIELYSSVFGKEAQLFSGSRKKLHKRLETHISEFYKDLPDKAIDFIGRLPIQTYDMSLFLPTIQYVLDNSIKDKIGASERIFDSFYSSGHILEIRPYLQQIPLFECYCSLTIDDEDQIGFVLGRIIGSSASTLNAVNLQELYQTLYTYVSVSTFKDIVSLSLMETPQIDFSLRNTVQLKKPFGDFQTVINDLRKSERVILEHKLPFFANSLETLNRISSDANKLPQPHRRIISTVGRKWQSILTSELMILKGRAELKIELKLKRFYAWDKLVIPVEVQNTGNSVAEDIRIKLISDIEQFRILDTDLNEIDILSPKESVVVNFDIAPFQKDRIRIAIEATFSDFDAPGKLHKFADMIEIVTEKENLIESEKEYETIFNNPYITGRPVQKPQMFFGRQEIVATIERSLRGRHQDNVIILQGERRSGKTSILYYLLSKYKDDFVPVLIDAQEFLSKGTEYFFWEIASKIHEGLKKQGIEVPAPSLEAATKKSATWLTQDFLENVREAIGEHRLLILFDEFDNLDERIRAGELDKEIFPFFRSLMQHKDWMAFIFSGTYRLEEMVTEYWSILFNIAIYLRLDFLEESDARSLITQPVAGQLQYDEFAIERILAVTSRHPYFIQLIGFFLYNLQMKERKAYVTSQDVDRVIDEVIRTQTHTQFIWKTTSRNEHFVLAAIGQEAKQESDVITPVIIRRALASRNINLSSVDINDSLTKLTRKGIIRADGSNTQFVFRVDLIRRWLRQYISLDSVINEEGRNVQ